LILDSHFLRLPVPTGCFFPWMKVWVTARPGNAFWFHKTVSLRQSGCLRFHHHDHIWTLEGRGGRFHWDLKRRILQTFCDKGFWVPQALRLADLTARCAAGQLACHASAVEKNGRLWLFAGRSGAGKTTASHLAEKAGWTCLQDDLVFLKNAHYQKAIDWAGPEKKNGNFSSKVTGICFLQQSKKNVLIRLTKKEALKKLLPIWGYPPGTDPFLWLEVFSRELDEIPVYLLEFRKETGFLKLLEKNS
jgi:hypothetical protein